MAIVQSAITILLFLSILVILVVAHEAGHFVLARLLGIRVLEFGIGFPPRARILRSRGETVYTLNWLPIGGFVKLEGEDGESDDPRSFVAARLWKKVVVLVAGVVMNLVVALVIFAGIALVATPRATLHVGSVVADSPAAAAGLKAGDAILTVDGQRFDALPFNGADTSAQALLSSKAGQTVTLQVRAADGTERTTTATLRSPAELAAGKVALGVGFQLVADGTYGGHDPVQALGLGWNWTTSAFGMVIGGLGDLAHSVATSPTTAPPVTGPVGIAVAVGDVFWQQGLVLTLYLMGLLSANLALVNILPIPPLDGGRVFVLLLKSAGALGGRGLRRMGVQVRGPSRAWAVSAEQLTYLVGFVVLIGFIAWVSFFDIARQIGGSGTP